MAQLPPSPGDFAASPPADLGRTGFEKPPWSVAAIAGFVLSLLLGCTVVGALLGLLLGIVGITRTRGGQRRGRGLAIAAIPIALVTGVIGAFGGWATITAYRFAQQTEHLEAALAMAASDPAEAGDHLRVICSDDFNDNVGDEQLRGWLEGVVATHGRVVDIPLETMTGASPGPNDTTVLSLQGKFVNGQVSVAITLLQQGVLQLAFDDIAVDGVSPRGFEGE